MRSRHEYQGLNLSGSGEFHLGDKINMVRSNPKLQQRIEILTLHQYQMTHLICYSTLSMRPLTPLKSGTMQLASLTHKLRLEDR